MVEKREEKNDTHFLPHYCPSFPCDSHDGTKRLTTCDQAPYLQYITNPRQGRADKVSGIFSRLTPPSLSSPCISPREPPSVPFSLSSSPLIHSAHPSVTLTYSYGHTPASSTQRRSSRSLLLAWTILSLPVRFVCDSVMRVCAKGVRHWGWRGST